MKKIINDFSVLAVEARLVQELPYLFSPADVIDIDDAIVIDLASESEESSTERTLCNEKLKILEEGLRALQNVQELSSVPQGTWRSQKSDQKGDTDSNQDLTDSPAYKMPQASNAQVTHWNQQTSLNRMDLSHRNQNS
jgi:hypothetical protein